MNMKNLIKSLQDQEQYLKTFLDCSIDKQTAIISSDIEGLQQSLVIESQLLVDMEDQSKKISNVIVELAKEHSVEIEENTLSEFLNAVNFNADNIKVIHLLQKSIKDLITKTGSISYHNKILIDHSRNFIRETISGLAALTNNKLLDRRI